MDFFNFIHINFCQIVSCIIEEKGNTTHLCIHFVYLQSCGIRGENGSVWSGLTLKSDQTKNFSLEISDRLNYQTGLDQIVLQRSGLRFLFLYIYPN